MNIKIISPLLLSMTHIVKILFLLVLKQTDFTVKYSNKYKQWSEDFHFPSPTYKLKVHSWFFFKVSIKMLLRQKKKKKKN